MDTEAATDRAHSRGDDMPRECAYVYYQGSYDHAPEYCDLGAEEDSEYCAIHQAEQGENDNSDEPYWGDDD
jgi:hypothetical protein